MYGGHVLRPITANTNSSERSEEEKMEITEARGHRNARSAESGACQQPEVALKFPKSSSEAAFLDRTLTNSILFQSVDAKERKKLIEAMDRKSISLGETVVRQGDLGDFFYVVASGEFDVYKDFDDCMPPVKVKHYVTGDCFGELALMYNDKRAASVIATTPATVWALDRATFRYYVVSSNMAKDGIPGQEYTRNKGRDEIAHAERYETGCRVRPSQPKQQIKPDKSDWRSRREAQMQRRHRQQPRSGRIGGDRGTVACSVVGSQSARSAAKSRAESVVSSVLQSACGNQDQSGQGYAPSVASIHRTSRSSRTSVAGGRGGPAKNEGIRKLSFPLQPQDWKDIYREIRKRDTRKSGVVRKATILDVMHSAGLALEPWQIEGVENHMMDTKKEMVDYHSFIKDML